MFPYAAVVINTSGMLALMYLDMILGSILYCLCILGSGRMFASFFPSGWRDVLFVPVSVIPCFGN